MKIKSKIIAFQIFLVGVVILMGAVVYFAIGRADYYIDRVAYAYRQLERITALSLHANRYSEQIAEMLLFGEEGRREFEEARREQIVLGRDLPQQIAHPNRYRPGQHPLAVLRDPH